MFETLKKSLGKTIGTVFIALLVLSFAVWGIGDVFRRGVGGGNVVVSVADFEITLPEAERQFDQSLREMRQRSGRTIERDQAMAMGLGQRVLSQLIRDRTVEAHAQSLGIVVDDKSLAQLVAANPIFQVGGRFDKNRFDELLRSNGMTEQSYLDLVRQDELRRLMVLSIGAAAAPPKIAIDLLHKYRDEQRQGRVLVVQADKIPDVPAPTEADLAAWLKDHQAEYRAPELRSFVLATMQPEDLAPEIEVSEDSLRQTFQERVGQFTKPATRSVLQLTAPDEATLAQARTRIQAGESAKAVATAMAGQGVALQDLGDVAQGSFPDPAVEKAIFAAPAPGVSETTRTAFGNAVMFVIRSAMPEGKKSFAEVRQQLRDEAALAQATDDLPNLENVVQDKIAGGASLEEAAKSGGFAVRQIERIDQTGNDPAGHAVEPPLPEPVLQTAFSSPQGVVSPMNPLPDAGAYILRIDKIEPERDRRLDEVRGEVKDAWLANTRKERAKALATGIAAQLQPGRNVEQIAASNPAAAIVQIGPLKRDDLGETNDLDPQAVEKLFATAPGDLPKTPVELPLGYGLVVTDKVIPAAPGGEDTLTAEIGGEMTGDLIEQYEQALLKRFPPVVHERVLAEFMRTASPSP